MYIVVGEEMKVGEGSGVNASSGEEMKLWKDRVTMLEEKIDITIQQKEQVQMSCDCHVTLCMYSV